ncbi:MAG: hypothetical protein IPN70_05095 [Candidatus Moraniibacteriota bacterium]|nr:MAG: hypothetical protein IPN70_05095 [Candidatus Moranbacteria bacterium]
MSIDFGEKDEYPGLENKFPVSEDVSKIPNLSELNKNRKEEVFFDEKKNFSSFLKNIKIFFRKK